MTNLAGITKTCCTLQFVFVIDIEQPIEDLPLQQNLLYGSVTIIMNSICYIV